jgi:hypothetical protein
LIRRPIEVTTTGSDHGGLLPDPRSFSELVHSRNKESVSIVQLLTPRMTFLTKSE